MNYQISKQGRLIDIELAPNEMSSGGQGRIFKVLSPSSLSGYCVKIYKDDHHACNNKDKIEYMVRNKPENTDMNNIRICWPEYIVYNNQGKFAGYVMPLAFEGSRDLKIIEIYTIGKTLSQKYPKYPEWHNKFEMDSPIGFVNRVKMLHNWALAIEIIHRNGKFVLVDLKPENVLATNTGKISIVDTDSFQINDGDKIFKGPVATPEYFSKFAKKRHSDNLLQTQDCDCFALAVSFYKILVGSHPYSGFKLLSPYDSDEYADIASRIDAELYVFGKNKAYIEQLQTNNMHKRFAKLPSQIQSLFMKAFTTDTQPSAKIWKEALKSVYSTGSRVRVPSSPRGGTSVNSECMCLCTLVIDVSGSMNICINTLNRALSNFMEDLYTGSGGFKESSKDQVEVAILQFDSECNIVREPAFVVKNERLPLLRVRGLKTNTSIAMRKAMELTENRKHEYKSLGLSYYRPWIILLTDGNPNPYNKEEVESLINEVNLGIDNHKFLFTAIGIGTDVDKQFLERISKGNYSFISRTNISSFFQTLSASMSMNDGRDPQEDLLGALNESIDVDI